MNEYRDMQIYCLVDGTVEEKMLQNVDSKIMF
jgi:hypothetical protein